MFIITQSEIYMTFWARFNHYNSSSFDIHTNPDG